MPCARTVLQGNAIQRSNVQVQVVINSRSQRADADIDKVLLSTEQLNEILDYMGRQIGHEYQDKELLVLGVLKGGFMFTADLIRHIYPVPPTLEVDFFKASSYGTGTSSSGSVKLDESFDLSSIKGKHVLVAEDIIDTGLTMSSLVSLLRRSGAMSVRVAVLLDKRARRKVTFDPDFVGMYMGEEFVVGYGIDFAERYRWLPYIGVPKPEVVATILKERAAVAAAEAAAAAASRAAIEASYSCSSSHSNNSINGNGTSSQASTSSKAGTEVPPASAAVSQVQSQPSQPSQPEVSLPQQHSTTTAGHSHPGATRSHSLSHSTVAVKPVLVAPPQSRQLASGVNLKPKPVPI